MSFPTPADLLRAMPDDLYRAELQRLLVEMGIAPTAQDENELASWIKLVVSDPQGLALLQAVGPDLVDRSEALIAFLRIKHNIIIRMQYLIRMGGVLNRFLGRYLAQPTNGGFFDPLPVSPHLAELLALGDRELRLIIRKSWERELINQFSQSEEAGLQAAYNLLDKGETPQLEDLLLDLALKFEQALHLEIPGFVSEIDGVRFPSARQRLYVVLHPSGGILAHAAAGGKTATALACFARWGNRGLVIVPASVLPQWATRFEKYWQASRLPNWFIVDSAAAAQSDFEDRLASAEIVLTSYSQMIRRVEGGRSGSPDSDFDPLNDLGLQILDSEIPFDFLGIDEAHHLRKANSTTSMAVMKMIENLRKRELTDGFLLKVHAITATPMYSEPEDMAVIAHIVRPDLFPQLGDYPMALKDPDAVRIKFIRPDVNFEDAEKLVRLPKWNTEHLDKPIWLEMGSAQRSVYDYVERLSIDLLRKLLLLRQITLHPSLVWNAEVMISGQLRRIGPVFRKSWAKSELEIAWLVYLDSDQCEPFNEDWLVENGFEKLFLACHFNYPAGIQDFIQDSSLADQIVFRPASLSVKFATIVSVCREIIIKGWDVVVGSALFRRGIIGEINGEESNGSVNDDEDYLVYQHLVALLRQEFDEPDCLHVLAFDAKISTTERELMRQEWRSNPQWQIAVISPASSEGVETAVLPEKGSQGLLQIWPDVSYEPGREEQREFRSRRPIQKVAGESRIYLCSKTIDQGCLLHLEAKQFNIGVLRHGYRLTADQVAVQKGDRGAIAFSPLSWFLLGPARRLALFAKMAGNDPIENRRLLERRVTPLSPVSYGQLLAEAYQEVFDRGGAPAFSASLVASVLTQLKTTGVIADIGCGTCGLQQKLGQPVINLDFCLDMLKVGREQVSQAQLVQAQLPDLPIRDGIIDNIVFSLVLDQIPESMRKHVIIDCQDKITFGGFITIVHSERMLDREHYGVWLNSIENLGWQVKPMLSGFVRASGSKGRQGVWLIVAENANKNPAGKVDLSLRSEKPTEMENGRPVDAQNLPKAENLQITSADRFLIINPETEEVQSVLEAV